MVIIGYNRAAPAGGPAIPVAITALAAQVAPNPTSPFGAAAHEFVQDLSLVPAGARCLLIGWSRDSVGGGNLTTILADAGPPPAEIVAHSAQDGSRKTSLAIWEWTKASESSAVFTVGCSEPVAAIGFQLLYPTNAHAGAVTATATGASVNANSCALSAPLGTAPNGVALFAAAGCDAAALSGSWSGAASKHADQSVEAFLQIHSASYPTDGTPLDPVLSFSGTNDHASMVAVSIPPA